jgi:hypothetical protein
MKSFRPKDEDDRDNKGWGDFRGQKRSNETHESKTDPEAKLMRQRARPLEPIVVTTLATSSRARGRAASHRTSRNTRTNVVDPRSTGARRVTGAT